MKRKKFQEVMIIALKNELGDEYDVTKEQKYINNNVWLKGIKVCKLEENISTVHYLDKAENLFDKGFTVEEIAQDMAADVKNQEMPSQIFRIFEMLEDYTKVKDRVQCRLINTAANTSILENIPNVSFLDLSIIFYVDLGSLYDDSFLTIRNSHMEMWNIKEKEILNDAIKNMTRPTIEDMYHFLKGIISDELEDDNCGCNSLEKKMYVMRNENTQWAPIGIMYPDVLEELAQEVNGDLIILPSSIYEVILMPDTGGILYHDAGKMVCSINEERVDKEEWLSNSVYRYNRSDKSITIVHKGKRF